MAVILIFFAMVSLHFLHERHVRSKRETIFYACSIILSLMVLSLRSLDLIEWDPARTLLWLSKGMGLIR